MKRLVDAPLTSSLLDYAHGHGISVDRLFAYADLCPNDFSQSPQGALALTDIEALFVAAQRIGSQRGFGLALSDTMLVHCADYVEFLASQAASAHTFLQAFADNISQLFPAVSGEISVNTDQVSLRIKVNDLFLRRDSSHYIDLVMATAHKIFSAVFDKSFEVQQVSLHHCAPNYVNQYSMLFNAPVVFNQANDALVFATDVLSSSVQAKLPDALHSAQVSSESTLLKLVSDRSFSMLVEVYISRGFGQYDVSSQAVAAYFHITERTLQRRLKRENTSFIEVRDRSRHQFALRQLMHGELDINELAHTLGFSDTTNFYQAFKRWEGATPQTVREQSGG